jgi:hypothetical protein
LSKCPVSGVVLSSPAACSSLDLAPEYLKAKARADKSTDLTTLNYSKKRGIASEYKQFKEQKAEVDRWESMQAEKVICNGYDWSTNGA